MNLKLVEENPDAVKIKIPDNWEDAIGKQEELLRLLGEQKDINIKNWGGELNWTSRSEISHNRERVSQILWHRSVDTNDYTLEFGLQNPISIGFDDCRNLNNDNDTIELNLHQKQTKVLLRLIFRETLNIMWFKKGESEWLKAQFKHILEWNIDNEELERFLISIKVEKKLFQFSSANSIAWWCIRKELLEQWVVIDDDNALFYIQGIIDRFIDSRNT